MKKFILSIFESGVDSQRWAINFRDFFKGLLTTVLGAAAAVIYELAQHGVENINWPLIKQAALIAAIGYISKQFISKPADGQTASK